ncbi:MAG: hypothetical protein EBQ96_00695 [Proteobacteria bacterium]|nr:hypothetical protein [Pseudomonadota bacterium]
MRFIVLMFILFLSACAGNTGDTSKPAASSGLGAAQAQCLSKGYVRGSFEFDTCYRNTPQVQAHERMGRLESLAIINKNKSEARRTGRSYPVE